MRRNDRRADKQRTEELSGVTAGVGASAGEAGLMALVAETRRTRRGLNNESVGRKRFSEQDEGSAVRQHRVGNGKDYYTGYEGQELNAKDPSHVEQVSNLRSFQHL